MKNAIEVNGLKKYFGDVKAVDDISFQVEQGSCLAFWGLTARGNPRPSTCSVHCIRRRQERFKSVGLRQRGRPISPSWMRVILRSMEPRFH